MEITKFLTMPKLHEANSLAKRSGFNRNLDPRHLPPLDSRLVCYVERHLLEGDGAIVRMWLVMPDETKVILDAPIAFFNALPEYNETMPDHVARDLVLWHVDEDQRSTKIKQGRLV